MSDKTKAVAVLLVLVAGVFFVIGYVANNVESEVQLKADAVSHGYADYVLDSYDGRIKFRWKAERGVGRVDPDLK
jgi:hypothetical protein